MNIISIEYIAFIFIGLVIFYAIPSVFQWRWLLLMSLIYYASLSYKTMFFLIISIFSTYAAARLIEDERKSKYYKKGILIAVTILNLALLTVVKYLKLGEELMHIVFPSVPINNQNIFLTFGVPMGISFYTLQVIGYLIDVYRGNCQAEKSMGKYALFTSYFPQILQGPIPRYRDLSSILFSAKKYDHNCIKYNICLIIFGYFKKMVIADRAAILVNPVFSNYQSYGGVEILLASILFSIQLYMDFSGCVDIVRGVSGLFGIRLGINFNHPYFAGSIKEFWRRWHISLSSWLRDYVYIPLGGNRGGRRKRYLNLLITFLVSGIWHGSGIHYILWGLLHGVYQITEEILLPIKTKIADQMNIKLDTFSHKMVKIFVTFHLVTLAWIFFRADSISGAFGMISRIFTKFNPWVIFDGTLYTLGLDYHNFNLLIFSIGIVFFIEVLQKKIAMWRSFSFQNTWFKWCIIFTGLFSIIILGIYGIGYDSSAFIYGQF